MNEAVIGKEGISARIVADSETEGKIRLTTFEIEYPRLVHSEFMTHRLLSKNAASSRAIPVKKMLDLIDTNPAMPVYWGKNQPGMSAKEELEGVTLDGVMSAWIAASKSAIAHTTVLNDMGLHKQIANRITEPWSRIKVVVSGTEWANFFYLRDHPDAQPEIAELAKTMKLAMEKSTPVILQPGEWHLPYVDRDLDEYGQMTYFTEAEKELTLENAQMISASCCAQVSYRNLDDTLEKAKMIFGKLIESVPGHFSPVEHQATPMEYRDTDFVGNPLSWERGVSHMDRSGQLWSGNFRGWIQYRKTIENEAKW